MKRKLRSVVVVDDHPLVRKGLAEVIDQSGDMHVTGEASNAQEARALVARAKPDLVIVDLSLGETSGLELIKDLRRRHPELPVLVVSMHDESLFAERSIQAGARGFIMKQEDPKEVLTAMRRVLDGKLYLSDRISTHLLETLTPSSRKKKGSPLQRLSDREIEVFEMIGRGIGTSTIAKKLHLSVKTIETHRAHIKEKLNLRDAAQLVQHAVQWVQRT